MPQKTNVFQDVWAGWTNLVREIVGGARLPKMTAVRGADLKKIGKRPNRAQLKRDLSVIRRPQPKRAESATKAEEAPLLRREPRS